MRLVGIRTQRFVLPRSYEAQGWSVGVERERCTVRRQNCASWLCTHSLACALEGRAGGGRVLGAGKAVAGGVSSVGEFGELVDRADWVAPILSQDPKGVAESSAGARSRSGCHLDGLLSPHTDSPLKLSVGLGAWIDERRGVEKKP